MELTVSITVILLTNQKNIQILLSEIIMHAQEVINADKLHDDIKLDHWKQKHPAYLNTGAQEWEGRK